MSRPARHSAGIRRPGRGWHLAANESGRDLYVHAIAGGRIRGGIRDNDANVAIPAGAVKRFVHPMDKGVPKPLFQLAAVVELADRVQSSNSEPNLDNVLRKGQQ